MDIWSCPCTVGLLYFMQTQSILVLLCLFFVQHDYISGILLTCIQV